MLARGDRANAERLVREAWRNDPMSEDTGEHPHSDQSVRWLRAGRSEDADGYFALQHRERSRRVAGGQATRHRSHRAGESAPCSVRKAPNAKTLLEAVPSELHGDPAISSPGSSSCGARRSFAEAAQLMPQRAERSCPPAQSRRMVDRAAAYWHADDRQRRAQVRLSDRARRALPTRDIYKTEQEFTAGWIALRLLNESANSRATFRANRRRQRSTPPRWRAAVTGKAAPREAAGRTQDARAAYTAAAEQSTSFITGNWRAPSSGWGSSISTMHPRRGRAASSDWRSCARCKLLFDLDERDIAIPIFADMGETAIPTRWSDWANLTPRYGYARGMLLVGKAALNRGCRSISTPTRLPAFRPSARSGRMSRRA